MDVFDQATSITQLNLTACNAIKLIHQVPTKCQKRFSSSPIFGSSHFGDHDWRHDEQEKKKSIRKTKIQLTRPARRTRRKSPTGEKTREEAELNCWCVWGRSG
jgi:hypothetical protein